MDKRKKVTAVGLIMALLTVVMFSLFMLLRGKNQTSNDTEPTLETENGLPQLIQVNRNETPLMYDFLYGSVGLYADFDVFDYDCFYLIAVKTETLEKIDETGDIWVSYYAWGEQLYLPPLGTEPQSQELLPQGLEVVQRFVQNMDAKHHFEEREWSFLVVESVYMPGDDGYQRVDNANRWAGIDFGQFSDMTRYGIAYKEIYDEGLGFDTEWLRRDEWVEALEMRGVNIKNEFFDRWNLYERRDYWPKGISEEEKETTLPISVRCVNMSRLEVVDGIHEVTMNEKELNMLIQQRGYEQ